MRRHKNIGDLLWKLRSWSGAL